MTVGDHLAIEGISHQYTEQEFTFDTPVFGSAWYGTVDPVQIFV
jgi:hypothetical protein